MQAIVQAGASGKVLS